MVYSINSVIDPYHREQTVRHQMSFNLGECERLPCCELHLQNASFSIYNFFFLYKLAAASTAVAFIYFSEHHSFLWLFVRGLAEKRTRIDEEDGNQRFQTRPKPKGIT